MSAFTLAVSGACFLLVTPHDLGQWLSGLGVIVAMIILVSPSLIPTPSPEGRRKVKPIMIILFGVLIWCAFSILTGRF